MTGEDPGPGVVRWSSMSGLSPHLADVLRRLNRELERLYGGRFQGLVLFGSYARGDAREGSDVDLLLLLEGPVSPLREIRRAEAVLWPLALSEDLALSLLPVSVDAYASGEEPFLRQVRKEGARVA